MPRPSLPRACPSIPFDILLADSILEQGAGFASQLLAQLPSFERSFWMHAPRIAAACRARQALERARAAC